MRQRWLRNGSNLCSDLEEALDEPRMTHYVLSADPFKLSLPHHVCCLDAFDRPLRSVEGAKSLHRSPPPPDEPMILLDDVRQVFRAAELSAKVARNERRAKDGNTPNKSLDVSAKQRLCYHVAC